MGFFTKRAAENANSKDKKTTNPYTKDGIGSKATDDRYMNLATSKRNWQIAFFIALGVIALQDVQLGRVAVHSKVEPWLVELNNGQVVNAVRGTPLDPSEKNKLIQIYLSTYIIDARTVINDEVAEKKLLDKVYARTSDKATVYLNDYYDKNDPFRAAASYTVSPDIVNKLQLSDNTWQITWDEKRRSVVDGSLMGVNRYVAQLTYRQAEPSPDQMNNNPFGIFITSLTWSQSN